VIDINNPAGRYYEILRLAKTKGDELQIRQMWAQVLLEDETDDSAITKKVIEVYQLGEEVKSLISMSDGVNKELYLSSFPQIERAIFPLNLNTTWKVQKQQLNDGVMTRLQFCSELLSSIYTEEQLQEEDLAQVTELIEELFDSVLKSSLDGGIRLTLLEEIERLRAAISMYKIKGAKGLKQSLQSTIGMVVANQAELSDVANSDPDVIERLGKLIDKVDLFTAKALKVHKALTKPVQFLIGLVTDDNNETSSEEVDTADESEA
jgi:chorismate mutase